MRDLLGRKTGGPPTDFAHRVVDMAAQQQPASAPAAARVKVSFFKDGFSLDGGPLRRYDDPANAAFMRDVDAGRVPAEIAARHGTGDVDVEIDDRKVRRTASSCLSLSVSARQRSLVLLRTKNRRRRRSRRGP